MFKTLQYLGFAFVLIELVVSIFIFSVFMPDEYVQPSRITFYLEVILYLLAGLSVYTATRMMSTQYVKKDILKGETENVRMQTYQKWHILRLCVLEAVIMAATLFFIIIPVQSLIYISVIVFLTNFFAVKTEKTAEAEYRNIIHSA